MRSVWIAVAGGVLLAYGWSQSPAGDAPALDPLLADPQHYHMEFQNPWVRVVRAKLGPHESGPRHRHPEPGRVTVFLTDQNILETLDNGATRVAHHKAGDVSWSQAGTHQSRNLNDARFETVEVEPTGAASGAVAQRPAAAENNLEAALVDPQHYHVEFENGLVRVIRFPMEPHDKTLLHTHPPTGAVIVALTDQNTRQAVAGGAVRFIQHKAGEAWWGAPNIAHQDENASDTRAVVIRIELKQAR